MNRADRRPAPALAGFTLIELLITVAIMSLLAGLMLVGITQVRFRAKALKTTQRIEAILGQLSKVGQQEGSGAYVIQRQAVLGGVELFQHVGTSLVPDKKVGDWLPLAQKYNFGFPWSQENLIASAEPDVQTVTEPGPPVVSRVMSNVQLRDLDPQKTVALLVLAKILPDVDPLVAFADRSPQKGWNDAWGNPLVVASGIFQPESGQKVLDAMKKYQYNRSVYLAIAAAGPTLHRDRQLGSVVATNLTNVWEHANEVCQDPDPTNLDKHWDYRSFNAPLWKGVKYGRYRYLGGAADGQDHRAFLSTPLEFR